MTVEGVFCFLQLVLSWVRNRVDGHCCPFPDSSEMIAMETVGQTSAFKSALALVHLYIQSLNNNCSQEDIISGRS